MEATYTLTNEQNSIQLNETDWQLFMVTIRGKVAIRLDTGLDANAAIELLGDRLVELQQFLLATNGKFRVVLGAKKA